MLLNEKIALLTGGTGAVGSVIANRLSAQGAHVIATYRHEEGLAKIPESFKQKIALVKADVTNEWEVTSSTTESYPLRRREHFRHDE